MPHPHPSVPLMVEVSRNGIVEARHHGSVLFLEQGRALHAFGDTRTPLFFRSSQKPFQALHLLSTGAFERYGLDARHLAIAAGSIDADEVQVALVLDLLERGGLNESRLQCPPALPLNPEARRRALARGEGKRRVFHNCAAKHAGMLLSSCMLGADPAGYRRCDHPIQRRILADTLATFGGEERGRVIGGDGCGAPVVAATLFEIATAFAALAAPATVVDAGLAGRLASVSDAMAAYPELVGGDGKRLDSEIMRASHGRLIAKSGAEGIIVVAERGSGAVLVYKADDAVERGRNCALLHWCLMLGLLHERELSKELKAQYHQAVLSGDGEVVGELRYCGPQVGRSANT